ncbi:CopD family protein [Sinomicrobium sp. M5D2P9]
MTDYYNYIKSLHLIFVITWFAGLFYIPRLFVYQVEAFRKPSPEKEILGKQLKIMARRLWYIITWPSAVLAVIFAVWLLFLYPSWLKMGWMHVKLFFVFLLIVYHLKTHQIFKQLQNDEAGKYSSGFMRIWNEGATILLFAIVFLVILKNSINWIFGVLGIIVLGILLMLGMRLYKRIRERNPDA